MLKRAQEHGIGLIVGAILLIAALVFVVFILYKGSGTFTTGTSDCVARGGTCVANTAKCFEQGGQPLSFECPAKMPACCKF